MNFSIATQGHGDFINITDHVAAALKKAKIKDGVAVIFVSASTAALTALEFEDGLISDLKNIFEKIAPENFAYQHHQKWGDHNGAAHIWSALIGPDLSIPIEAGKLLLGTWHQIVLIDFDEKPRTREVIVKFIKA